jgi:hypothetical protein
MITARLAPAGIVACTVPDTMMPVKPIAAVVCKADDTKPNGATT